MVYTLSSHTLPIAYWQVEVAWHSVAMTTRKLSSFAFLALAVGLVALGGCVKTRTWVPDEPGNTEPEKPGNRIVVFAPVATGKLRYIYPKADLGLIRKVVQRVNLITGDVDARVGESLPDSDDEIWAKGPVGAAAGAHLVVTTEVDDIVVENHAGSPGMPPRAYAYVTMKAYDANGVLVWGKERIEGRAKNEVNPKFDTPESQPESKAAYNGVSAGVNGLRHYLESQGNLTHTTLRPDRSLDREDDRALIEVNVDSIPGNAEIYVDGVFRGTTPSVVPLPVREVTIMIERPGYDRWEHKLTPSPGIQIQPALAPEGTSRPKPTPPRLWFQLPKNPQAR